MVWNYFQQGPWAPESFGPDFCIMAASSYFENSGPRQDFAISRGEIWLGCLLSQDSVLPKRMLEVSSRWLLLLFQPESPEAPSSRLTQVCGMMKWQELIFTCRSHEGKRRQRHQKAPWPLWVKKEGPYQEYLLSFHNRSFKWWHSEYTGDTHAHIFHCPFRSGLLERGCSLFSPFMLLRCWCHTFCSLFICERMAGMWIKSRANFLSTLTGLGKSSFRSHYKWDSASFSAFPASHNHFEFDTLFMGDVFLL